MFRNKILYIISSTVIILSSKNINYVNDFPKILIKIPTRQRPIQFFNVLDKYYQNLSGEYSCTFLISCDLDDSSMNNETVIKKLKIYPNLYYYFSNNKTKVEAYNSNINNHLNFDILLVSSDDTWPSKNFDEKLVNLMIKNFPDLDGVINFNDGHVKNELNTLPVIGKKYYQRFGYIYHKSYYSLWCDTELTTISKILNKEIYSDEIIIEHKHPLWNNMVYDDLYIKNNKYWDIDKKNFEQRQINNFYLTKHLEVQ